MPLLPFVQVFFDDILIYNKSMPEHIQHLTITLQLLQDIQESKCMFATPRVSYFSHIIQAGIVAFDPDKIQAILLWPKPTLFTTLPQRPTLPQQLGRVGLSSF